MKTININVSKIMIIVCIIVIIISQMYIFSYSYHEEVDLKKYEYDWIKKCMFEWNTYMGNFEHSRFIHSLNEINSILNCVRYRIPKLDWDKIRFIPDIDHQLVFSGRFAAFTGGVGFVAVIDLDTMDAYRGYYFFTLPWALVFAYPKCLAVVNDTFLLVAFDTLDEDYTVVGLIDMRNPICKSTLELELIWLRHLNFKMAPVFSFYNGYVVVPLSNGSVVCLDWWFGDIIWRCNLDGTCFSGVSCWNGLAFLACMLDGVYCLNVSSGDVIWKVSLSDCFYCVPMIVDGRLYVGGSHRVYCFDALNGELLWTSDVLEGYVINIGWHYSGIFVLTDNHTLYKLDANCGEVLWNICDGRFEDYIQVSDYIVNCGKVLVDPWTGELYALPDDWSYVQLISSDLIYIISSDGKLKIMEPSTPYYVVGPFVDEIDIHVNESSSLQVLVDVRRYFEYSVLVKTEYNESIISCTVSSQLLIKDEIVNITVRGLNQGETTLNIWFICSGLNYTVVKTVKVVVEEVEEVKPSPSQEEGYNVVPYVILAALIITCAVYAFMRVRRFHSGR